MGEQGCGSVFHTGLRHVVYALSNALDLVGVDDIAHGKRVGIMASECMACLEAAGVQEWWCAGSSDASLMFDLGLLHDIGVSSTQVHRLLIDEFNCPNTQEHCTLGHALLRDFVPLAVLALPVLHHHTRWDTLLAERVDPVVAQRANLIHLVDRVDALAAAHYGGGLLAQTQSIRSVIAAHSGTFFAPELVALFLYASRAEAFWLNLETRAVQAYMAEMLGRGRSCVLSDSELKQVAVIFSRIVDAKSPFTAEHSLGVSRVARLLAERSGLAPARCDKVEIAGLMHDIGKLRVPDEILDKHGRLDERERMFINSHSFETYQILRLIPGFKEIARWAAYHHEDMEGNGYPFHLSAGKIAQEARILRVADIFQAMVQDRPHRKGLSAQEVRTFMLDLVDFGGVDESLVNTLLSDLDAAIAAACPARGAVAP